MYYSWNNGDWINSNLNPFNGEFTLLINTESVENGEHELSIMVVDRGASIVETFSLSVLNDENPPTLEIVSPDDGTTVEGIIALEVEAVDDNQLSDVEFQINQGDWRKMYYNTGDSYIASWNTQEANAGNGDHQISFRAIDMSYNEVVTSIDISVLNEEDITYPYLGIINPKEEFYNNRINIEIKSSDPDGIANVQYSIDNGSWKDLSSEGSDMYTSSWTPTWDGWHWLAVKTEDNQGYETENGIRFETDSTPPSLMLNSFSNDISAIAEFDLDVYDYSNLLSLKYRINGGSWTELERDEDNVQFTWDSTKYDDGECLMEIECTDNWGGVSTLYRNLDVKNQGLIYSIPPSNIETEKVTKITSIVDYDNPKSVYMILAKIDVDVLAEGQKIPMNMEGNYYVGEIYFENPGLYVYSIEVDTGHGKLSSYEQNIIVSAKQSITNEDNDGNMLLSPNILSAVLMLIFVAMRRKD